MSLDGLAIRSLAKTLKKQLCTGKVDKIAQPNPQTLTYQVRVAGENKRLLASISPQNARLVLSEERFQNPETPPLFVMVLRKHLQNAQITDIYQLDYERMIIFELSGYDEIGESTKFKLIFELMGKNSNIILLNDQGIILDAMRKVGLHTNTYRQIQPGLAYIMPPSQNKLDPFDLKMDELSQLILKNPSTMTLNKALLNILGGFGPQSVEELIYRANIPSQTRIEYLGEGDYQNLEIALRDLKEGFTNDQWQAEIVYKDGEPFTFAPFTLKQFHSFEKKSFEDLSVLLETYYHVKEKHERFTQQANSLGRIIQHEIERCEKKYSLQLETIAQKENAEIYRIYGELITANLYRIKQGETTTLENFYDNNAPITIALNPQKTPNDNAQAYFKTYNRAKNGASQASKQAEQTKEELDYLKSILDALHLSQKDDDLLEIRQELEQSGYLKAKVQKKKQTQTMTNLKTIYQDYEIYIGKNNLQNDYLTLKLSRPKDLWLHTKAIHGSHVLIKSKGEPTFPDDVILQGAKYAAYFSKARYSTQVPVDYTLKKFVHKPSGAKPGMVIYTDQKTVYVTPEALEVEE